MSRLVLHDLLHPKGSKPLQGPLKAVGHLSPLPRHLDSVIFQVRPVYPGPGWPQTLLLFLESIARCSKHRTHPGFPSEPPLPNQPRTRGQEPEPEPPEPWVAATSASSKAEQACRSSSVPVNSASWTRRSHLTDKTQSNPSAQGGEQFLLGHVNQ